VAKQNNVAETRNFVMALSRRITNEEAERKRTGNKETVVPKVTRRLKGKTRSKLKTERVKRRRDRKENKPRKTTSS
jgi:hypothetical protein